MPSTSNMGTKEDSHALLMYQQSHFRKQFRIAWQRWSCAHLTMSLLGICPSETLAYINMKKDKKNYNFFCNNKSSKCSTIVE